MAHSKQKTPEATLLARLAVIRVIFVREMVENVSVASAQRSGRAAADEVSCEFNGKCAPCIA